MTAIQTAYQGIDDKFPGVGVKPLPRVVLVGDSRTDQNDRTSGSLLIARSLRGYAEWLGSLTGQRFDWQPEDNLGVAGETTAEIRARLPAMLARRPNAVIYYAGTNDRYRDISAPQSIENIRATIGEFATRGIPVLVILDTPRTDAAWSSLGYTGARLAVLRGEVAAVNRWIIRYAQKNRNVFVVNATRFADGSTGQPVARATYDGTHPATFGAYQIAQAARPFVEALFQPFDRLAYDVTDTVSDTNPAGNLLPEGGMFATTGTALSAPFVGNAPTGWAVGRSPSSAGITGTATVSRVARADGAGNDLVMAFAAVAGGTSGESWGPTYTIPVDGNLVRPGDNLELLAEMTVSAGAVGYVGPQWRVQVMEGSTMVRDYYVPEAPDTAAHWPTEATTLTLRSPVISLTPGATSVAVRAYNKIDTTGAGCTATVRVGRVSVRVLQ